MIAFALDSYGICLYLSVFFYVSIRNPGTQALKVIVILSALMHKKPVFAMVFMF